MVLILYLWDYYRNWVLFHTLISYKFSSFVKCLFKTLANSWIISHFFVDLFYNCIFGYEDLPDSSVGKESTCNAGDPGLSPGLGRCPGEGKVYSLQYSWASLVAQLVKILLQCGRPGFDPWVGKILWRREKLPFPVFWPGAFHGLYSPWGCKESDTTE